MKYILEYIFKLGIQFFFTQNMLSFIIYALTFAYKVLHCLRLALTLTSAHFLMVTFCHS